MTGLRVGDHVGYDVVGESEIGDIVLGLVVGVGVGYARCSPVAFSPHTGQPWKRH